ncbi:M24 family metallopeptidase [Cryobacterium sp. PH29-G1]|uniref:M24 family metallopeptidase n=1 Tax=Cryobacterium sp. PH29-G1 TaxID=3046211 RepID=UPI0024BA668C|nr:M24 family metallopeptidase [Cryobacterium sp. PH29-G1]MDJ0349587.1 M24 family metallopeptidase [Cryobacterium sp. PH29-G1]
MSTNLDERDRRWGLLNDSMREHSMDCLIFAANDYRGHKGALRYVTDYNLFHRSGNAVMFKNEEPIVVLSGSLAGSRRPTTDWVADYRFPGTIAQGLVDAFSGRKNVKRVGIVGFGQIMKVDEYLALTEGLPGIEFFDYTANFEKIRVVKSPEEIIGVEESAYVLDQCFTRLLEIARPGVTEREIGAEMYRVGYKLGGEDPLFLTMYTENLHDGVSASFAPPRGRELNAHDLHTFSFEIVGPRGYWTELSRMVTFATPHDDDVRMARAVSKGITAAAAAMKPGTSPNAVQQSVLAAIESEGAVSSYWSGHSLGLDVLEQPWIGLDVVEDDGGQASDIIEVGNVFTIHPMVVDQVKKRSGYMSDTFVIESDGARKLSEFSTALHCLTKGNVNVIDY